jgi:hypothetical protein
MTANYTSGPWRVSEYGAHVVASHRGIDEMLVANCGGLTINDKAKGQ